MVFIVSILDVFFVSFDDECAHLNIEQCPAYLFFTLRKVTCLIFFFCGICHPLYNDIMKGNFEEMNWKPLSTTTTLNEHKKLHLLISGSD